MIKIKINIEFDLTKWVWATHVNVAFQNEVNCNDCDAMEYEMSVEHPLM